MEKHPQIFRRFRRSSKNMGNPAGIILEIFTPNPRKSLATAKCILCRDFNFPNPKIREKNPISHVNYTEILKLWVLPQESFCKDSNGKSTRKTI